MSTNIPYLQFDIYNSTQRRNSSDANNIRKSYRPIDFALSTDNISLKQLSHSEITYSHNHTLAGEVKEKTTQESKDIVLTEMENLRLPKETVTTQINQLKGSEKGLKVSEKKMENRGANSSRVSNKTIVQKPQQTQKQRQKQMRRRIPSWAQSTGTVKMCVYIAAFIEFRFPT